MSLKGIAQETLAIIDEGRFVSESGKVVNFAAAQKLAEKGTTLYRSEACDRVIGDRGLALLII
jgi:hypothetical protein